MCGNDSSVYVLRDASTIHCIWNWSQLTPTFIVLLRTIKISPDRNSFKCVILQNLKFSPLNIFCNDQPQNWHLCGQNEHLIGSSLGCVNEWVKFKRPYAKVESLYTGHVFFYVPEHCSCDGSIT